MKLCQRCTEEVVKLGLEDIDYGPFEAKDIEPNPVPESECEFYIHQRYNRLSAACKKYIDADHELDKLTERVERT